MKELLKNLDLLCIILVYGLMSLYGFGWILVNVIKGLFKIMSSDEKHTSPQERDHKCDLPDCQRSCRAE